ncbi:uncharacterized protein TNCV_559791 [Trichonephila clavipes]|nr:uncharacterized protein TNCV_559791 [Trichonephila clavipes]
MKPRCLKCGKEHATRNCHIKERQLNPFCINCQDCGHSACYTKCPKFPQPKKGTAFSDPLKKKNFSSKWTKEGISFANVVSGEISSQTTSENKKEDFPRGFLSQDNNSSDLAQVLELFNIICIEYVTSTNIENVSNIQSLLSIGHALSLVRHIKIYHSPRQNTAYYAPL